MLYVIPVTKMRNVKATIHLPEIIRQMNVLEWVYGGLARAAESHKLRVGNAQVILRIQDDRFIQATGVEGYLVKTLEQ